MTAAGSASRPAVFLDRDGVLNRALVRDGRPRAPRSVDQFELYPDAADACRRLHALAYAVVVITNQPDVARGELDEEVVEAMHAELHRELSVDAIYSCFHDDGDACDCRKPAPGLLLAAAGDLGIDLSRSIIVGDRWRDVEAGRRAGCRTVLVDRHYRERLADTPDFVASGLAEAVRWIEEGVGDRGVDDG